MKVAFATSDNVHVDAHFGWAKQVALYEVSPGGFEFCKTIEFKGDLKEDGNEDKLVPKIAALSDCAIVYVSAIGGSAATQLIQKKITPIRTKKEDETIEEVLNELLGILNGDPPPWLRKIIQAESKSFDFEDED